MGKQEAHLHCAGHPPQHQPSGPWAEGSSASGRGGQGGRSGLGASAVAPPCGTRGEKAARVRRKRRRASGRVLPCKAGSSAGASARTARLAGAQVRGLPEGRGRPQSPSRPTSPTPWAPGPRWRWPVLTPPPVCPSPRGQACECRRRDHLGDWGPRTERTHGRPGDLPRRESGTAPGAQGGERRGPAPYGANRFTAAAGLRRRGITGSVVRPS